VRLFVIRTDDHAYSGEALHLTHGGSVRRRPEATGALDQRQNHPSPAHARSSLVISGDENTKLAVDPGPGRSSLG
jgi:hypothetical protein